MFLVFDIGATNTRMAVSADGKTLLRTCVYLTPANFLVGINTFVKNANDLFQGKKLTAVAGGIAGPYDRKKGKIVGISNLPQWVGKPFKKELERRLQAPVYVDNDTAIVGLGEATRGAGKGFAIVAYITVSTGVNGVRVTNGKIDATTNGFEIGMHIIQSSLARRGNGQRGHLETFISGAGLAEQFKMPSEKIKNHAVWKNVARYLAIGIHNSLCYWSPEIVILGGSLVTKNAIDLKIVKKELSRTASIIFPTLPPIRKAVLGDDGGLYGALAYLQQRQ